MSSKNLEKNKSQFKHKFSLNKGVFYFPLGMKSIATYLLLLTTLFSCQEQHKSANNYTNLSENISLGDSLSMKAQKALISTLTQAISDGGFVNGVSYCNENANKINTNLEKTHKVKIERVSNKNRNPQNALLSTEDKQAFEKLSQDSTLQKHFMQLEDGSSVYYKPIKIGMPTCLKCHGNKQELDEAAFQKIKTLYPEDKAINYSMGELRGMWKISFQKP